MLFERELEDIFLKIFVQIMPKGEFFPTTARISSRLNSPSSINWLKYKENSHM